MGTLCQQCGDKGFSNALIYCVKCLDLAVHRYCLNRIPETFDEFVPWVCEDCQPSFRNYPNLVEGNPIQSNKNRDVAHLLDGTEKSRSRGESKSSWPSESVPLVGDSALLESKFKKKRRKDTTSSLAESDASFQKKSKKEKREATPSELVIECCTTGKASSKQAKEKAEETIRAQSNRKGGALINGPNPITEKQSIPLESNTGASKSQKKLRGFHDKGSQFMEESKFQKKLSGSNDEDSQFRKDLKHQRKRKESNDEESQFVNDSKLKMLRRSNDDDSKFAKVSQFQRKLRGSIDEESKDMKLQKMLTRSNDEDSQFTKDLKLQNLRRYVDEDSQFTKDLKLRKKLRKPNDEDSQFANDLKIQKTLRGSSGKESQFPKDSNHKNMLMASNDEDSGFVHSSRNLRDNHHGLAQPVVDPVWRGSFSIRNKDYDPLEGFVAHVSSKVCYKACEEASLLPSLLSLEMLPKYDIWPRSFQHSEPSDENIALYFFPAETKQERVFDQLVEEMMVKEMALRALVKNAELLIFTSTELSRLYWRFQDKFYLWGVFKGKKPDPSSLVNNQPIVAPENSGETVSRTDPAVDVVSNGRENFAEESPRILRSAPVQLPTRGSRVARMEDKNLGEICFSEKPIWPKWEGRIDNLVIKHPYDRTGAWRGEFLNTQPR